jgi:hypothetical protein
MVDLIGAQQFIAAYGTPLQDISAQFVLGLATRQQVIDTLALHQQANGGWAGLVAADDAHPVLEAAQALRWCRWISAENHPIVANTTAELASQQRHDGVWPGASAAQTILLTAAVCRAVQAVGRDTDVYFGPALSYLKTAWDRDQLTGTPISARAYMLPLFNIGGQPADTTLIDGLNRDLLTAVHRTDTPAAAIVTIAHTALNSRYAGSQLYVAARDRALTRQATDGGWEGATMQQRTDTTAAVLMLLRWGGML